MPRSRASAKKAGSSFERLVADFLADVLDDRIDRRVKTGSLDKGDIAGIRFHGHRLVNETKDYAGQIKAGEWIKEAQTEAVNDGALMGFVTAKRKGTAKPEEQWVIMTLGDLVLLLTAHELEVKKKNANKDN
jgi:hypothetical protein